MQIDTSFQHNHHLQSQIQTQHLRDSSSIDPDRESEQKAQREAHNIPKIGELRRQTYGLSVLKDMSDNEYRAFLRATVDMSESEKIFAAQSLYRLNRVYQEQFTKMGKNPYQPHEQEFIQAFQNALSETEV